MGLCRGLRRFRGVCGGFEWGFEEGLGKIGEDWGG